MSSMTAVACRSGPVGSQADGSQPTADGQRAEGTVTSGAIPCFL